MTNEFSIWNNILIILGGLILLFSFLLMALYGKWGKDYKKSSVGFVLAPFGIDVLFLNGILQSNNIDWFLFIGLGIIAILFHFCTILAVYSVYDFYKGEWE